MAKNPNHSRAKYRPDNCKYTTKRTLYIWKCHDTFKGREPSGRQRRWVVPFADFDISSSLAVSAKYMDEVRHLETWSA